MERRLTKVEIELSTIAEDASHTEAWSLLRDFSNWSFFQTFDKHAVTCSLLPGDREFCMGSRRLMQVWDGQLVEQLAALDDVDCHMSYKLVTHPSNCNPFGCSFVDHFCKILLRPVTMTGHTFVELRASFRTDSEAAEGMRETLSRFHEQMLDSLAQYLRHRQALSPFQRTVHLGTGSSKPMGAFDFDRARSASLQASGHRSSFSGPWADRMEGAMRQDSTDSTLSQHGYPYAKITTQ